MRVLSLSILVSAALALSTAPAAARPNVALHLSGSIVHKVAGGEKLVPLMASTKLKTGEIVRFTIVAANKGSDPALRLTPIGKIPSGTAYVPTSASPDAAQLEFSMDNGKTWSAKPTVTVQASTGPMTRPADPSTYTAIRWNAGKLAPGASTRFAYEVRVK